MAGNPGPAQSGSLVSPKKPSLNARGLIRELRPLAHHYFRSSQTAQRSYSNVVQWERFRSRVKPAFAVLKGRLKHLFQLARQVGEQILQRDAGFLFAHGEGTRGALEIAAQDLMRVMH